MVNIQINTSKIRQTSSWYNRDFGQQFEPCNVCTSISSVPQHVSKHQFGPEIDNNLYYKNQINVQNLQRTNSINVSCMIRGPIGVFILHNEYLSTIKLNNYQDMLQTQHPLISTFELPVKENTKT
jgi:hypothetical protein